MLEHESQANVLQPMLRSVGKTMASELRRLNEFGSELTPAGLSIMGGILCGAHYLESSLQEPDSNLMVFEAGRVLFSPVPCACLKGSTTR